MSLVLFGVLDWFVMMSEEITDAVVEDWASLSCIQFCLAWDLWRARD
jgi:hypothetical protein